MNPYYWSDDRTDHTRETLSAIRFMIRSAILVLIVIQLLGCSVFNNISEPIPGTYNRPQSSNRVFQGKIDLKEDGTFSYDYGYTFSTGNWKVDDNFLVLNSTIQNHFKSTDSTSSVIDEYPIDIEITILDFYNNPLKSAGAVVKGSSSGCATDSTGYCVLRGLNKSDTVSVSFLLMKTLEIPVKEFESQRITINLLESLGVIMPPNPSYEIFKNRRFRVRSNKICDVSGNFCYRLK